MISKNGRTILLVLGVAAILGWAVIFSVRPLLNMVVDESYERYADVDLSGRSSIWCPDWMPDSAKGIRVRVDADTSEYWATFESPRISEAAVSGGCSSIEQNDARLLAERGRPRWWPRELTDVPTPNQNDMSYYACGYRREYEGGGSLEYSAFLAVIDAKRVAYWWSNPVY